LATAPKHEPRLSLKRIEEAARSIDPVFLNTPQFLSDPLGEELGMRFLLKVETVNPIRSFKGRGADFFVSGLPGNSPMLVCASAGNFGQGMAYAARKRGFQVAVFAAETANPLKLERMRKLGADVRLFGREFDAAKQAAREFADATGARFVEDGLEPAVSEGAGTIAVELCRWREPLDFLFVPLGDGALLAGIGLWMKTHSPRTRLVAVCAEGAPAMALSFRQGRVQSTEAVSTIADGIATRIPVPEAFDDLQDLVDEVLLVSDDSIILAMQLAFRHHGLVIEPAGAAGLAAAITYKERFRGAVAATVLTGGNLTSDQIAKWLSGSG
jgi:threonine dehydratase